MGGEEVEKIVGSLFKLEPALVVKNGGDSEVGFYFELESVSRNTPPIVREINRRAGRLMPEIATSSGLSVVARNDLAGDPCKGVRKQLVVEFEHDGRTLTRTVTERETLSLP